MMKPMKKKHVTAVENGHGRVVSTRIINMVGMTYWGSLSSIPNYPFCLAQMQEQLKAAVTKMTRHNYSNSRDAAHAGNALQRFFGGEEHFYDLAFKAALNFPLTAKEAEIFRLGLGFGQRHDDPRVWRTAAHPIVHAAFGLSLHEVITEWAQLRETTCYIVTIISKPWHTSRARPKIDIDAMKAQVTDVLTEIGFDGFLIMEIQGMRSQEQDLLPHFHGIISPKRKGAVSIDVAKAMLAKAFPGFENVSGVEVKPCITPKDVEHFLMYAAKSPATIKRLHKDKTPGSPTRTREGAAGYSNLFALDILRVRSTLSLPATVLAHGTQFKGLKKQIFSKVKLRLVEWGITRERSDLPLIGRTWANVLGRKAQGKNPKATGAMTPTVKL